MFVRTSRVIYGGRNSLPVFSGSDAIIAFRVQIKFLFNFKEFMRRLED